MRLTEAAGQVLGASWGTDDQIVYGTEEGLFRVSGGGGEPGALTTLDTEQGETSHMWPFIIPGREAVVFAIGTGAASRTAPQLAVLDLDTGEVKRLGLAGVSPHYASTGHLVYAAGDGWVRAVAFDAVSLEVTGTPVPLVEGVTVKNRGAANRSASPTTGGWCMRWEEVGSGARSSGSIGTREGREEPVDAPLRNYVYPRISPSRRSAGHKSPAVLLDVREAEGDLAQGPLSHTGGPVAHNWRRRARL